MDILDDLVLQWQVTFQYSTIHRIPALNKSDYGVCDVEVAKAARTFYFQVQNKTLSIVKKSQQLQYHEHSPRRAHHHHQQWPPHQCLQWTLAGVGCRPGLVVAPGISTSTIICHQIVSVSTNVLGVVLAIWGVFFLLFLHHMG